MEGEPASSKDRVLLSCVPHLVLDGAMLAAFASDARRVLVCVLADGTDMARAATRALDERHGQLGARIPADDVRVEIVSVPPAYVAGEESALVSWLDGGNGAPMWRPDKGVPLSLGSGPAVVHNAEKLAHMALIVRYGPAGFRAHGLESAPGTTLVTVSGAVGRPGVYEHDLGTPLDTVVAYAEPADDVAAVLTGGYGRSWIPGGALGVAYAPGPLATVGGIVGAGVVAVLPRRSCGIAETARLARYMSGESAGQCGPCVFGLPAIAGDLARLAAGRIDGDGLARLERRCAPVEGRGACRHPDGVARLVRSALTVFAADAYAHARGRTCACHDAPSVLPAPTHGAAPR